MKITVDESLFIRQFEMFGRTNQNGFSYPALRALFEYYEQLDEVVGQDTELDVIAICCDWAELSISEIWSEYSHLFEDLSRDDFESDEDLNDAALEVLSDNTQCITVEKHSEDNSYLVLCF